jgi:hypothetical protein
MSVTGLAAWAAWLLCVLGMTGASSLTREVTFTLPKYSKNLEKRCIAVPVFIDNTEGESQLYNVTSTFKFLVDIGSELPVKVWLRLKADTSVRRFLLLV